MENALFPPKSTFDTWQYSSCTLCVSDIILAFLWGLGLFFLLLRYLENNVSSPPPRKHENIRKHQMEPKGRRKINEKKRAVKACRNSLKELEKARDLISLLQSHLHKLPDKGGFHQLSCQDPLGEVGKAAPAAAHQPCREPAEDDVPAVCPSAALVPLTQGSLPVASTLSTEPQDQSNLKRVTLGTVAKCSPPGNSFLASTTAAILSLGLACYHNLFLSCWWKITKAFFFPTSSQSKSWQEHLSHQPPGAPSSGGPTDKQVETGSPLFVNPEVQKLLELLITKKVKLNTCKEKEKDGSFSEQMSSDYHLNTLGNMWKSLGAEQDNTTPQSFWNMKDNTEQLEQLPGPQQLLHSEVLRDHLEQKYSQLYWGLPSLHSESLVAVRSAAQQQAPFVLCSGVSHGFSVSIQPRIPLGASQAPVLPCPGVPPQPFTQNLPPCQPPPLAQIQKQLKSGEPSPSVVKRSQKGFNQLILTLPQDRGRSQAQRSAVSFHHEDLIGPDLQKQHLQKRLIKEQTKRGLARSIHLSPSLELSSSQCQFLGTYQAQGKQGPWQPSAFTGKRRLDRQKIRSRCPRRSHRKGQIQFQPGQDFGKGLRPCLRRISKASSRTSLPVKFLQRNSEKESERYLMRPLKSNSGNCLPSSPEQKHLEKFLKAHLSTKLRQINQGMTPVMVRQSWLAANYASYKPHPREEIRNLASSKYWKPCVDSSRELSFLSPSIRQMLEAHVIRWRVRHRWGLPNQAFEPINLKPGGAQPLSSPRSTFSPSATCQSRAHSKANLANKLSGKPQPHQGMKVITKATVLTLVSPLPVPSPEHTEIQRALGQTSPGDRYGPSEAPVTGQEGRLPYQMPIVNLMGRSWENGTVLGFPATRKTLSPPTESVGQPPKEPCLKTQVAQGRATGELLPDSHSDILLQDYAIGMPLQDFATNVLLQDHHTDVLLSSHILASHRSLSSSQREHASEDAPAFQVVPYDLNVREQSSRGQQTFKTPQLQDPFKGQREMSAPTEEWRDFQRPQPKEHEEMKSQREMLASAEEWRGFTKPQPGQHEETKSQSNVPAPAEEWRCVRSLQAGEHEETRSNQEQQEPRKPKVRDPCKDQFASTEGREDNWKPKPGEYKERSSGLKASQASGMSQASQVRERGESLGSKHPQLSPGKRQLSPESQKRTKQYVSHDKKGKGIEESLQKGKPASATAHQQKPIKGKPVGESRAIDPCATARAVGQVLREKLGLHQGLCASKLNLHPEQLQAPAQGHSHHHRVLSSSEQRRVLKDTAYSHQASPKDHSYLNKSRHTTGRGDKLAFPPRELESPVRRCQHGPRLAGDSGHLRHHPTCPQKCVPSGQPECASHAFPGGKVVPKKVQFMERKPASSHVNKSSMC
ncbi:spermatogenesis-associated protein 31E1-like [Lagenorhynchus albirostris]|uniref:spermatogenesis-associated protein 31E1-like n=1 Tax=Lagenorhynchus albirostris TaxID=27610 RepID=UPI0028EE453F|nr:spermatogenesis-associated protein 31E1-like [Lagenorhynchus albirostris]